MAIVELDSDQTDDEDTFKGLKISPCIQIHIKIIP